MHHLKVISGQKRWFHNRIWDYNIPETIRISSQTPGCELENCWEQNNWQKYTPAQSVTLKGEHEQEIWWVNHSFLETSDTWLQNVLNLSKINHKGTYIITFWYWTGPSVQSWSVFGVYFGYSSQEEWINK